MLTHVTFTSDAFPPDPDEETLINPGLYGRRLAQFLVAGLSAQGFVCHEPIAEDWGWLIPVENDAFDLWIGCGYGNPADFHCFIEPHKPFIRKFFKKIETRPRIESLQKAMDVVLSHPSVRDRRWWTHDGFDDFLSPGA